MKTFLDFTIYLTFIQSDTIVHVIKDTFIRLQLSLSNCRGQCYDRASNMLGKKSGVAKKIQACQPKAHATHCHGHALSLSVKVQQTIQRFCQTP